MRTAKPKKIDLSDINTANAECALSEDMGPFVWFGCKQYDEEEWRGFALYDQKDMRRLANWLLRAADHSDRVWAKHKLREKKAKQGLRFKGATV